MSGIALLFVFTVVIGWVAPRRLAEAGWTVRAPRTALAVWCALLVSGGTAAAMAAHRVLGPRAHRGFGFVSWLVQPGRTPVEGAAGHLVPALLVVSVFALAGVVVAAGWLRAARTRAGHRELLDLIARPAPDGPWWVVDDDRPTAWCVPGRDPRIVLTRGALESLTAQQRAAVVAHERAHLTGRHHLLVAGSGALGRALPWLPLARTAAEQVPLLAEMAADDAAAHATSPRILAQALCTVAAGPAPAGAMGAGTHGAVERIRRLVSPRRRIPYGLRVAWWAAAVLLPVLPVLLACGP